MLTSNEMLEILLYVLLIFMMGFVIVDLINLPEYHVIRAWLRITTGIVFIVFVDTFIISLIEGGNNVNS